MCQGHEQRCTNCGNKRWILQQGTQACRLTPSQNHNDCPGQIATRFPESIQGCAGNGGSQCTASPELITHQEHPNQRYDIPQLTLSKMAGNPRRAFTPDDDKLMRLLDEEYRWTPRVMQREYWPWKAETSIKQRLSKVRGMRPVGRVPPLAARQPSVAHRGGMGPGRPGAPPFKVKLRNKVQLKHHLSRQNTFTDHVLQVLLV